MNTDQNDIRSQPEPADQLLKSLLSVLFRRKSLIIAIFLSITATVATGTFLIPKKYGSSMKILVKNERADLFVTPDRTSSGRFEQDVNEDNINSEIELLTGTELLESVVRHCGLQNSEQGVPFNDPEPEKVRIEQAVRRLRRDLSVTPIRKAPVIEVTYVASTPEKAPQVLRKLADAYLAKHLDVHRTPGALKLFSRQAASFQKQLRSAEDALTQFQLGKDIYSLDEQRDLQMRQLAETESELLKAKAHMEENDQRAREINQRMALLEPRIRTQSRSLPNQYSVERLNTMLVELKNRRTELLTKFQDNDRLVSQVDGQIKDTKAALRQSQGFAAMEDVTDVNPLYQQLMSELAEAQLQIAGAQGRATELRKQVLLYRTRLASFERDRRQYNDLTRRVKQLENNYLLYSNKQEEARISESIDEGKIANVLVSEGPSTPSLPSSPKVGLNLALGVFFAGFISLGCAFGRDYASRPVRIPRDVESLTGIPVLATVPSNGKVPHV